MNQDNTGNTLESAATSVIAASTKTPFKTAFSITMGIGLGRLALFFTATTGLILTAALFVKLFGDKL